MNQSATMARLDDGDDERRRRCCRRRAAGTSRAQAGRHEGEQRQPGDGERARFAAPVGAGGAARRHQFRPIEVEQRIEKDPDDVDEVPVERRRPRARPAPRPAAGARRVPQASDAAARRCRSSGAARAGRSSRNRARRTARRPPARPRRRHQAKAGPGKEAARASRAWYSMPLTTRKTTPSSAASAEQRARSSGGAAGAAPPSTASATTKLLVSSTAVLTVPSDDVGVRGWPRRSLAASAVRP